MPTNLANAVEQVAMTLATQQRRVLEALMFAPKHSASATQLQQVLGLTSIVQPNSSMGQVGKKVYKLVGAHPDGFAEGNFQPWSMLATGDAIEGRGFVWTLRPQVAKGLRNAGFSEVGPFNPSEVSEPEKFIEGAVRQVSVNAYERNPVARARCIEKFGTTCSACGIDFRSRYGDAADGYIHVHHLRPLASLGSEYEVDPIKELRPVCPNCHSVIHLATPPYSIEQVIEMLHAASQNT